MASKLTLELHNADLGYRNDAPLLTGIDLTITQDGTICVLGQNGTGKTTLFRTLLGFLPPLSGSVTLDGRPLGRFQPKELAKLVAYVPQAHHTPFPYTVNEVVLFGRTSHMGFFGTPQKKDRAAVERTLDMLDIRHLARRTYTELSGGERQMVIIARALAQEARLLILDEPASSLDYGNQVRLLDKIRMLAGLGTGILMATHQPDQAFLLDAQVLMLSGGNILRSTDPAEALQPNILKNIYGVDIDVVDTSNADGSSSKVCRPMMTPLRKNTKTT
ncbi:ABC transporter ATP-binding protein [Prosthecochloris sp. HL-130-GSB]|uniref:ABC transporter ATP-binding protein n=1 Tax=Prosthecochloris aestuarii TaxID=1102 RepID=A0A831SWA5_PROAE|nr:ABC transporter ATP-binding protein [Prosthecochloris sp. HL-130-GSB]ARM30790.1 iron ABC transporter ATP-binding protein [Prosthecochloris sp. HL-130-GSB]MBO8093166.1 ABC transporter ATP-binding protein [Prosthecochloris sp.]HED31873.1 ABC transporter ATP-binding protein [Prosthecochloris aestuarii]